MRSYFCHKSNLLQMKLYLSKDILLMSLALQFTIDLTESAEIIQSRNDCLSVGFNPTVLSCDTCEKVQRMIGDKSTYDNCKFCCMSQVEEKFNNAVLEVDNRYIHYMPELEAIIKIKDKLNLEVKYRFGSPQLKMYNKDDQDEAVETLSVSSWSQDNFKEYIKSHLVITV